MSLPHASLNESTRARLRWAGGLRKHLLVLGIIIGCGANHAIWSHAQEVQREAAEHRLEATIRAEHGYEPAYFSYVRQARGEWWDFLECDGRPAPAE